MSEQLTSMSEIPTSERGGGDVRRGAQDSARSGAFDSVRDGAPGSARTERMRTVLICHEADALDREGLARWLASFTDLTGVVVLRETRGRMGRRIKREIKRVGPARFLDVLAFRLYYKLFLARRDREWGERKLSELRERYAPTDEARTRVLHANSPNSPEAEAFIRELRPDIMIARCKTLLKESVFSIPERGTFVMHPGVCPEYRNAHGCFWALARGDYERVGMTLLRIDKGVDTGPVYGYYTYPFDEVGESHAVVQARVVIDNFDALERKLAEIHRGEAAPLDTSGRRSGAWGQPWLSSYLRWKRRARKSVAARSVNEI